MHIGATSALALFLSACSAGSDSVDKLIGPINEGNGQTPTYSLDFDPNTWDFGKVLLTATTPLTKTFDVKNQSGKTLFITKIEGSGAITSMSVTSETCTLMTGGLLSGKDCQITVSYLPATEARHEFNVTVKYGEVTGDEKQSAVISVFGEGASPANLAISDGPIFNFGPVVATATAEKVLTVTNAGGYAASSIAGAGLAAPFDFKGGAFPGTGGTCTADLDSHASCTIVVTFNPPTTGPANDIIELTYFNGDANSQSDRPVEGTGATPASLAVSDGPVGYDFGTLPVGAALEKTFTITNSGGVAARTVSGSGLSSPFTFKGGAYPGTGGTCGAAIPGGNGTCTVVVRYAPTATGTQTGSMNIDYFDGLSSQQAQRMVQGTAVTPALLAISHGPTHNFGTLVIGNSSEQTFTVTNSGQYNASFVTGGGLAAPYAFKGGAYPGTGGNCGGALSPGSSCDIVVTYIPTAAGPSSDTIEINYSNGVAAAQATRALQGIAVPPAVLAIAPTPDVNFGTRPVGSSTDLTVTVTNTGGTEATAISAAALPAPFSYKGGTYPGTAGTCATSLMPAAACTIVVTYAPLSTGSHAEDLDLTFSNGVAAVHALRSLKGVAVTPANLSISDGPTYDFGSKPIGSVTDHVFTVSNSGGYAAASVAGSGLASPFSFKGGSYPGTGGTCGASLAGGANCTIVVSYAALSASVSTDTVDLSFNDGNTTQTSHRDLTATGVTPATLVFSNAPSYDFGPVATGGHAETTLLVTNTGDYMATTMAGAGLAAPFTFKGGTYPGTGGTCGTQLAGGVNCSVVVVFAPTTLATLSDTVELSYFNGATSQQAVRDVQGVGTTPATLAVSNGPTFDFGALPYGASSTSTLTVTNTGGVPASAMTGAGLSAPFTFLGGTYPGTGGTCAATLAASASCTVVLQFSPSSAGTFNGSMLLSYYNTVTNATTNRAVTGTGVNPANLAISSSPFYSFGTIAVGGIAEATLTVTNGGQFIATTVLGDGLAAPFAFKGGAFPGVGGTCSTSLNAGSSCSIVVTYNPGVTGLQTDDIEISYFNGAGSQLATRTLSGTGAAPASLSLDEGPAYDFGDVAMGAVREKIFTLSNGGGVGASAISGGGLAAPFAFKGGAFPGTGGNCGLTLAAGASCSLVVTFAPTAVAPYSDDIEIGYFNGAATQGTTRNVVGNAVAPAQLALSDGPLYNFGTIPATGTAERTFTVTNSGSLSATAMSGLGLTAPFSFKGGTYPGTGGTCAATLTAGGNCTVVVTFAPTANGPFASSVQVAYHNGVGSVQANRDLQGVGAPAGSLSISGAPTYDFGSWPQGATREATLTVTNTGGVPTTAMAGAALNMPFLWKGGGYPGTGGTCATDLPASGTCTLVIEFAPGTVATFNENLTLNYNNGLVAVSSTRALTGTAVPPALLVVDAGPTYDYGTVPTGGSLDRTFTVTNSGAFTASSLGGAGLSAPFTFKGGSFPGGGTCAATLNVGASCTFIVTYAPTATGSQSGTIQVTYNNGVSGQTSTRGVTGTGAAPASLSLSHGPTLDYGTLPVGATADHTFTLTNSGGVPASAIVGTGLAAPFSFKGGLFPGTGGNCSANLAASASCTIVVTFAPTAPGTPTDDLEVNYNDGVVARTTLRALAGTAVPPGAISITDGPTFNYGFVAVGATKDHSFTLTNTGGYLVTSLTGSGLTTPYSYKGGPFPGTGGNCGTSLAAGATCTMVVSYAPSTTGAHNATAQIGFFDGALSQTSSRALQGQGALPASLAISNGPFYDFGTKATGSVSEVSLTVSNSGGVPATTVISSGVSLPYRFKGGSYPGTGGTCLAQIAAAGSCTLVVEYVPTATGSQIITLDLAYDNGVSSVNATREIRGVGAAPASIGISDGPQHDFGILAAGGTADKTLTLTNSGGVPATAMSGGGLTAPFGFKGGGYPGTGGTCNTNLNAGSTCTVVVSYNPSAPGSDSGAVQISYNDGVTTMSSSRNLVGTAVAPALLTVSHGATFDFGIYPATASIDQVLTITNSGSLAATAVAGSGLAAPFSFKGGPYPGTGGTCGTTINAAATCSIVVTFNPTVNGSYNDEIEIAYFDGAQARTGLRPLQGTAAPPAQLTITDGPTYNFGNVAQGGSRDKSFTVTNGGGVTATAMSGAGISAPFTYKDGVYPGTGGTCSTSLPATQSCTIVVNYNPTTVAVHNSTIEMNYHNGLIAAVSSRNVTGTGVTPAILDLSDSPHVDFGTVATGGFIERSVTVTNNGNFAATSIAGAGLDAPYTFKGGTYPGTGGSCLTTLNIGASCTIIVRFAPTGTGAQNDTIEISYNNGASGQTSTRDVQGIGAAPALIGITDAPFYDYGTLAIGGTKERIFTLTNSGGVPAASLGGSGLDAPFTFKGGGYPGTAGTCTTSLAAGGSCTVIVVYAPSAVGNHSDAIDVNYHNGVSSVSESRSVQGTAVSPANINISNTPTYNFNTVAIGAVGEHAFTLTNTGSFQATSLTQSALSAPYAYKGGVYPGSGGTCNATLNGGASCTVVVTFTPTVTGVQNATMSFAYDDGAQAQNKSVGMTGTGATAANLTITNSPSYNYGTRATGSTLDQSFTITNTGGVAASALTPSGLTPPFAFKGGSYPGTGGDCGANLAPAGACTVIVTYAPTTTGAHSVTLAMGYQNGVTTTSLNQGLNGTGAAPASVTISHATSFDFGTRAAGSVAEHTFVLTNSGGVPASSIAGSGLDAPFSFKGGSFPGAGGTCSGSIPAASTCTVVAQFAPAAAGSFSDTFEFSYHDGVATQGTTRDMVGTGTSPAQLTLSHGSGLNFGAVPVTGSADLILTVTNSGGFVANSINVTGVSAPFSFKGGSYPGSGGNCGTSLGVSNSCQIALTFAPSGLGAFNATLDVGYDNGVNVVSSTRAMQGTGAPPATLTISEAGTYNFGVLANNSSAERSFTITNTGGVTATAMGGAAFSAPYSFKGGTYPGTGGTCAATLGATLTCSVVVVYAPTTIAVHNANLTMNYNDGLTAQSTTRPLTGESVAPGLLSLTDTPSYDYGTIAIGASRDHTFTVTNTGSFVSTSIGGSGLSAPFTFKGANVFPGTGGTCTTSLNPGASCTIVVTWAPIATGAQSATMSVNYFSGSGNLSSTVGVQGVGANVALISMTDGPLYDFGDRATGSQTDKSITLTNTGGVPATSVTGGGLAAPFTFKNGTFPGTGGTCTGGTLAAGASCTIVVTFAPGANGTVNDTIEIDYNNGLVAHQVTRDLRGTGQPPAALTITNLPTYDFGPVATTGFKDRVFTITNTGGLTATALDGTGLALPFKFKGVAGTFPGTGGTCVTTLAPAATCTIVVSFLPTVDGPASDTINLSYNDGAAVQALDLGVQGTGAPPAVLAISGSGTFNYGTVANGGLRDQSFTVSNTGGVEATVVAGAGLAAPFGFKGGSYPGTGGNCGTSIPVAGNCTVVVTYSPTNIATHNSNLQIDYFDGLVSQNSVRPVQGTAVAPALLDISGVNPVAFGTIAIGNSSEVSFTVTNNGSYASSSMSGAGLSAPFNFKGGAYPGTGGNCAASLAVGASCTVVVTFTPSGTGVNNSTLQVLYNDGAGSATSSRTVTGTGTTPANITISEAPFYNFGAVANGSVNLRSFTLTNIGGVAAASLGGGGLALPFSFEGGTFPGTTGTCGTSLAPGATCTAVVSYAPTVSGPVSDDIDITYHNTVSSQSVSREVRGSSTAPALLAISGAGTYNFGPKANGSVTDATFTVTNNGQFNASAISVAAFATSYGFKGGSFPGSGGTCDITLAPAASCTVVLTFAPATSGTWNANLDVGYNNGVTTVNVARPLTGTSTPPAVLTISGTNPVDFGTRATGATSELTFTLANTGSYDATAVNETGLAAPFGYKGGAFPGTGGTCATTIAASTNCTVVMLFSPVGTGLATDSIVYQYNNGVSTQSVSRDVQGTGVAPALIVLNPSASFDFGAVANGSVNDKIVVLTNTGGLAAASLTGVGLSAPITFKDGTFPGTGGNCSTSLAAGASCNVVVTYAPTVTGSMSSTLNVNYNNGVSGQTSALAFTGSSSAPAVLTISGAGTYNFGPKANGSVTDATFTITNTGAFAASAISTAAFATHYNFKGSVYPGSGGTCGITLAPSGTCTIVLSYSPTVTGTHNAALDISYNDGVTAQSVVRNMTGTSSPPAVLTISDSNPYDFGTVAVGAIADHSFTITNTGGYDASTMAEIALAAPFYYKGGTYPGTGGNCGTVLSATASCSIVVTYTPTATGTQNGTLQMQYNNGVSVVTSTRTVTGVGVAPALLTITPAATWDFGAVANGSVNDKSFTITNTGGLTATGIAGGGLAAPVTFKGGGFPGTGGTCSGGTLAAGATCTFVVTYAPLSTAAMADTIEVAYHNGVEAKQVTRDVIGSSSAPAVLAISETGTFSFGAKANGSVTDKTFTITNSGAFTASALAPTAFSAPYSFKGNLYPGSGGTCGLTLPGGQTCTVVVTFSPTVTGTHNSTLEMAYNDGVQNLTVQRGLTGVSSAPAVLTISGSNPVDFGTIAVGASADQTFTLQNTGGYDASSVTEVGLAPPFAFKGGTFPGTGGNCATPIAASASCTIVVTYTPTGTGLQSDAIEMSYNNGVSVVLSTRNVQGTGVAPANIAISGANPLDFGTVATGGAKDMSVTLTNTGGLTATSLSGGGISAPFTFKGGGFPGTGGTCTGGTLAASGSCTVVMTYSPVATGLLSGTLDITFNNGVSGQTVSRNVQGTGAPPASLTMSGSGTYDFGPVALTGSAETTFTITNGGGVAATAVTGGGLAAPFKFKGVSGYPGTGGTCGTTINPAASCTIVVQFNPTTSTTDGDSAEIGYNDGATVQTLAKGLQGTGAPPATLTISGAGTYIFPTLARGGSAENTFTVTNTGGVTATAVAPTSLSAPFGFKGGAYPGTGGSCNTSIAPGANCTVVIVYSPTNVATHNQDFVMNFNDGLAAASVTRPMQGTALTPATLAITNASYDFGTLATGASADMTLTVTNSGDFTANIAGGTGLDAPYTFKGGNVYPGSGGTCNTSLAVSASCTIVVTFAPTGTGSQSDTIQINYFDGAVNQTAQRTLTGFGAAPAQIVISDPPSYNFGSVANGGVAERSFTISNTGGVPADSLGGSGLAAPFSFKGGTYPGTGGDCSTSLGAGASCTVVVRFQPTVTNSYANNMSINYHNGVAGTNSVRAIEGSSADPAMLTISETGTYDYGTVANGATKDRSFTIANTGGVTATGMNVTGLAAPFGFKDGSAPGTGGNCSATLAPGANCTVVIAFAPTAVNSFSGNVTMNYNTGLATTSVTRPVQGIGASPATLVLNLGPTYNFNTVARGSVNEVTFTLTNTGGAQAVGVGGAVLIAPYAYKGGTFPGAGGNCGPTLNGSQSCDIVVTYSPSSNGTHNSTIQVNYSNTISNLNTSVNLTAVAVNPASLSLDGGNPYDYGTRVTTSVTEHTFTMTNNGAVAATNITGAALPTHYAYKGGSFPGTGGSCTSGGSLNPAATCTIIVNYSPSATGTHSGAMTVNYNDGANAQTATQNMTGVGSTAAQLTLSNDPTLDFGNVATGASYERTLTVTNSGGVAATSLGGSGISAPYAFKGGTFPGTGGNCLTSLGVGLSCTVVMVFSPTVTGVQNATIDVTYNDGLISTQSSRNMTGTGVGPASLAITPAGTHNFGNLVTGATSDQTFTITNSGGVAATSMSGATLVAPYSYPGAAFPGGGTCLTTLNAGATCTFVVRFSPTATGTQPATATINYFDAANNQSVAKNVTGTGIAPTAPTPLTRMLPVSSPATNNSVQIKVEGVAQNDVVRLFTDGLCSSQVSSGTVATGQTEITLTAAVSSDGNYVYYANRTNSVGTVSACSTATATYSRDTTPPTLTSVDNHIPGRFVHWNRTPTLRVVGIFNNDIIKIYTDATCTNPNLYATFTGQTGTSVDLVLPQIPSQGKYGFTATAEDALGNKTSCVALTPINTFPFYVYDVTDTNIEFASFFQAVNEGTTVNVVVTLGAPKVYDVKLIYRAVGSAADGVHTSGIAAAGTVLIPAGQNSATLTFQAIENGTDETDTYLDIAAYDADYEYVHAAGKIYHRVLIRDNDGISGPPVSLPQGQGSGYLSACYIGADKKLRCMGRGAVGQVGNGTNTDQETYVVIDATNDYRKVSTGGNHACAITDGGTDASGTLKCWGYNNYSQLGNGVTATFNTPQTIGTQFDGVTAFGPGVKEVSAGSEFTCAIDASDDLYCWGRSNTRQARTDATSTVSRPRRIDANKYRSLTTGATHGCAIRTSDNYVYCWGSNGSGQSGGATNPQTSMNNVQAQTYTMVSAGDTHTCGVTTAGKVRCWGAGASGRLGTGGTGNQTAPQQVDGGFNYVMVSAGRETTCGITDNNDLRCTGQGNYGMLMDDIGTADNVTIFSSVQGSRKFTDVNTAYTQTWATIKADATPNSNMVLSGGWEKYMPTSGDGKPVTRKYKGTPFDGIRKFSSVDAGYGERATCNITMTNKIRCTGNSSSDTAGMFGISSMPDMTGNIWVDAANDYSQVATGRYHICAIRTNGKLFCAGHGSWNGVNLAASSLTAVDSSNSYSSISIGDRTSCGITTSGELRCWGRNDYYQVGDGTNTARTAPVTVDSGVTYSKVEVGYQNACGITNGGVLKCWGRNNNDQVGDGSGSTRSTPTVITSGTTYIDVGMGTNHACAVRTIGGRVVCWGLGSSGQIGDNTTNSRTTPTLTADTSAYTKISVSDVNSCGIRATGELMCWGSWVDGIAGELAVNADVPVQIDSAYSFTDIEMGRYRACARTNAQEIRCWGNNWYNAFGDFERAWIPQALPAPF